MRIYVFGNPLVKEDSLVLRILPRLKKEFNNIEFLEFDPSEDFNEERLVILDVVKGIKEVKIIEDIDKIELKNIYSLHDFDLGFNLKLLKKIGKLKEAVIIGVPMLINEEKAFQEVKRVISSELLRNEKHKTYKDHKL